MFSTATRWHKITGIRENRKILAKWKVWKIYTSNNRGKEKFKDTSVKILEEMENYWARKREGKGKAFRDKKFRSERGGGRWEKHFWIFLWTDRRMFTRTVTWLESQGRHLVKMTVLQVGARIQWSPGHRWANSSVSDLSLTLLAKSPVTVQPLIFSGVSKHNQNAVKTHGKF